MIQTAVDPTGRRFGRLLVVGSAAPDNSGQVRWRCRCDCGNETTVRWNNLRSGNTKSCGCLRKEMLHQPRYKDLTGQRFGRLTVVELSSLDRGRPTWKCRCDCGKTSVAFGDNLKLGKTSSCGCIRTREIPAGARFGRLTVLGPAPPGARGQARLFCFCDCGKTKTVEKGNLRSGRSRSCGCQCGRKKTVARNNGGG